eukprot:5868150-Pyramimonas_sp.AAC.1
MFQSPATTTGRHLGQRGQEVEVARLPDAGDAVEGSEQDLHVAGHGPLKEHPWFHIPSLGFEGDAG